jgi:hypothetical protein
MSRQINFFLSTVIAGLASLALTSQGCGGGSSSGTDGGAGASGSSGAAGSPGGAATAQQICNSLCDKYDSCGLLQGLPVATCKQACTSSGAGGSTGGTSSMSCPNLTAAQATAKFNQCLAGACDTFLTCVENICPSGAGGSTGTGGTHGAGGSTGSGGSHGAGGTTGSGDCATTCAKAGTCCTALFALTGGDGSQCSVYATTCASASAQALQACQTVLSSGATAGVAACL